MNAFEALDEWGKAWLAARYSMGSIPGDWSRFPTGSLLLALEMLPYEAPRLQESLDQLAEEDPDLRLTADVARAAWTLQEVLSERGVL